MTHRIAPSAPRPVATPSRLCPLVALSSTLLVGCVGPYTTTATTADMNSSGGESSTGTSSSSTETTEPQADPATTHSEPTTTSDAPVCGNGEPEDGEECDDGNLDARDACLPDCKLARCGDGIVWTGVEQCDDANGIDDSCTNGCKMGGCGDGIVWTGQEECDDANDTDDDACTNFCELTRCGDGKVQQGEDCDDANQIDEDDCSNDCVAPRLVFMTRIVLTGDLEQPNLDDAPYQIDIEDALTGLARADAICKAVALHGGLSNQVEWRAWLSDDTGSPSTRFDTFFAGYYKLVTGTLIAKGYKGLTSGSLLVPINVDESGVPGSETGAAWTNTNVDGSVAEPANHCENWTQGGNLSVDSVVGLVDSTDQTWTRYPDLTGCTAGLSLYCFQHTS